MVIKGFSRSSFCRCFEILYHFRRLEDLDEDVRSNAVQMLVSLFCPNLPAFSLILAMGPYETKNLLIMSLSIIERPKLELLHPKPLIS